MYLLPVPPFVELKVATTDEEVWQLRRHDVVVKPPLGGTPRRNLDEVVEQWCQFSWSLGRRFSRTSSHPGSAVS